MKTWLAKLEVTIHAEDRHEAWGKARILAESLEGDVVSIPQTPEEEP